MVGIVPALRHSHEVSKLALSSAKAHGVETVFTTAWGDNGAEASIFTILPTLCLYAEDVHPVSIHAVPPGADGVLDELIGLFLLNQEGVPVVADIPVALPAKDPELLKLVPADVMLVYWDYYSTDRQKYDQMFAKHLKK